MNSNHHTDDPRIVTDRPLMASDRADECDDCAYISAMGEDLPCFDCFSQFSRYDREAAARGFQPDGEAAK